MNSLWTYRFLRIAAEAASWSKDPSTKVGAAVVWPDKIYVTGYNGFPRGMHDTKELYKDRDTKYSRILHAEENAILNALNIGRSPKGAELFITHPPCNHCGLIIIQSGIVEVNCPSPSADLIERWGDSIDKTNKLFNEVGIKLNMYNITL